VSGSDRGFYTPPPLLLLFLHHEAANESDHATPPVLQHHQQDLPHFGHTNLGHAHRHARVASEYGSVRVGNANVVRLPLWHPSLSLLLHYHRRDHPTK